MMTIVYVCICVTFCIALAFWVGKKIGQSSVFNLEKKMKEFERNINTMQEGFDQVVDFYIKDLERHTEEIKELLVVADKKCLYANDLLVEIDNGIDSIKRRNLTGETSSVVAQHDKESLINLKHDVKTAVEEIYEKIGNLDKALGKLKETLSDAPSLKEEDVRAIVNNELSSYLDAMGVTVETAEINNTVSAVKEPEPAYNSYISIMSQNGKTDTEAEYPSSIMVEPVKSVDILPSDRLNRSVSKEKTKEIINRIAKKDISYLRPEVLKMYADGVTVPQIAREMRLSIVEVEMIVNLYGGVANNQ